jgi:3-isopropylmalate dehydrogenase
MYKIAILPGDGIGPEVVNEGLKVIKAAAEKTGFNYEAIPYDFGGERYLAKGGDPLPDSAISEFKEMDAIYLGAVGHPDVPPGVLEHGILLKLRFSLDLYINLRPIKLYPGVWTPIKDKGPEDIDFIVVRENTEDLYVNMGGFFKKGTPDEVAIQQSVNTRKGVERCIRFAYELTKQKGRKKLTLCDKANVLTYAHDLWRRVFNEVGNEYPDVQKDYAFVDATTMWMIKNPEWFDVIVTCNMFGDIITDLGAMIQGGMGVAASGNINPESVSMFEPIHGSAPKYKGTNSANPLAAICAAGMMLDYLGEKKAAELIDNAVTNALSSGKIKDLSAGKMGMTTSEVGDFVASLI